MPFEERSLDLVVRGYAPLAQEIERVVRERNPAAQRPDEPRVIWEENPYLDRVQVTVIWDRWQDVDPEVRGRIIVDAVETARGQEVARKIGLALGVTPEQAERLGVS
jgi:hypothetical protein